MVKERLQACSFKRLKGWKVSSRLRVGFNYALLRLQVGCSRLEEAFTHGCGCGLKRAQTWGDPLNDWTPTSVSEVFGNQNKIKWVAQLLLP